MGKRSLAFVRELGHRVMQCTGEVKARTYLLQRLSVAVQRGNAVSVMGSVGGLSVFVCLFVCLFVFEFNFFLYMCTFFVVFITLLVLCCVCF